METSVSPQVRVVALVGLVAALALGGGMMLLTRSQAEAEADAGEPALALPVKEPAAAAPAAKAKAAKPVAKPAAKPAAAPKPEPRPEPAVAANGFPMPVVRALRRNPVAVVALHNAGARTDLLTVAEAEAGALAAGAAFVRLDGQKETEGGALARLLGGVVDPPVVLVYQRPTALFLRFDGYVDKETVAQAALNAGARGTNVAEALVDPWLRRANAVCAAVAAEMPAPPTNGTRAEIVAWGETSLAAGTRLSAGLAAIPPTSDPRLGGRIKAFRSAVDRWVAAFRKFVVEARRNDDFQQGLAALANATLVATERNEAARQLHLASCEAFGQ